jgi:hypothetical protein
VRDADGQLLLAVLVRFCDYDAVVFVLPSLLASGQVVEITRDEYMAALPRGMP